MTRNCKGNVPIRKLRHQSLELVWEDCRSYKTYKQMIMNMIIMKLRNFKIIVKQCLHNDIFKNFNLSLIQCSAQLVLQPQYYSIWCGTFLPPWRNTFRSWLLNYITTKERGERARDRRDGERGGRKRERETEKNMLLCNDFACRIVQVSVYQSLVIS